MMLKTLFIAAAFTAFAPPALADAERTMTIDDMHRISDVTEPSISPDGSLVAYTLSRHDLTSDATMSDIWVVPYAGGAPKALTNTPDKSEWTPRFSPDGKTVAFLGEAADDGSTQIFLMKATGGKAKQVSQVDGGVLEYDWSPDGRHIVLTAFAGGAKANDAGTPAPIVIDRFQFMEDYVGYLAGARRHLFVLDTKTKDLTQLTEGAQDYWLPAWSPDGKWIAYVSKDRGDADRNMDSDVFIMAADGSGAPRRISTFTGTDVDPYWMSPPAWSPDSKKLAWLQSGDSKWIYYAPWQLTVADLETGETRDIARIDRCFYVPKWSADGKAIYALIEQDRSTWVARVDAASGEISYLDEGDRFALDFDVSANDKLVLLDSNDNRPFEIYAVEQETRALTDHNAWLDGIKLGTTRRFDFQSDGHDIGGLIVLPPDYEDGKPLPAIFRVHGGPVYQFSHEFMYDWQIYAAKGYAVVGINPRGSSGKGFDFSKAIYADWGNVDVADVLAGADYLAAEGIIDPERMGIGGWSYGGILTDFMIARDTRFKAAVSGAGAANMYGTYGHDQYSREYELELGTPWDNRENYDKASYPFLNAQKIKTPTLFQCSELDFNVPCIGAEQMYQALKSVGVDTRLVIYPGQHHGINVPSYLKDRVVRNLDWYDTYVRGGAGG